MNPDPHAVAVFECPTWEQFKLRMRQEYAEEPIGASPLFRGHARADWKLASPWDRKLELWTTQIKGAARDRSRNANLLTKILGDFKDLAIGLPGIRPRELRDDDWWALGRHYGLLTPFLDWTKSPYVAAFFAFTGFLERISPGAATMGTIDARKILEAPQDDRVAIWCLNLARSTEDDEDPEGIEIEVVSSRLDIGHRQRAQRGVFTRLSHNESFDIESYLATRRLVPSPLTKYLIPGREASHAITELRMMNITFATLFPDLEGAALQSNFEMVIFTLWSLAAAGTLGHDEPRGDGRGR